MGIYWSGSVINLKRWLGQALLLALVGAGLIGLPATACAADPVRDLHADTWVATDAVGRSMPSFVDVGAVKKDHRRVVGMFYITWHSDSNANPKRAYSGDVSRILSNDPKARLDAKHPLWNEGMYLWGEPEMGYFLSRDEYVIRHDLSMLADAGVDVLILDVTNAVRYWDEWETLFSIMQRMRAEGNQVPQFCFWAFNGPVISVVQDLYERIYKPGKYREFWFEWEGKPLLLYNGNPLVDANGKGPQNPNPHFDAAAKADSKNPHFGDPDFTEPFYLDYTREVKSFFTPRTMWWGYSQWAGKRFVGTEDNWSFGLDLGDAKVRALTPLQRVSTHQGRREEIPVTPAQHPSSFIGKSWTAGGEPALNEFDLPEATEVPWLGKKVEHPEGYGIYFQQRWDEALSADPDFLYLNDWNEWTAGKYPPSGGGTTKFMRRDSSYFFVDQYNAEFNRAIQPMKGGYTDNYYMQMAENIRRYKGVSPAPELHGFQRIKIDGDFADWNRVGSEYLDTIGDTVHRDYAGYGGIRYTNNQGRNDFVRCQVAVDAKNVYFHVETRQPITHHSDTNWMLLLIDTDHNPATGWYGYDFGINLRVINDRLTTLMRYDTNVPGGAWVELASLNYRYSGNGMELAIPRKVLGLEGKEFIFDFHWCDNPTELKDPISLCLAGDSAPNRRFNYRCIWKDKAK